MRCDEHVGLEVLLDLRLGIRVLTEISKTPRRMACTPMEKVPLAQSSVTKDTDHHRWHLAPWEFARSSMPPRRLGRLAHNKSLPVVCSLADKVMAHRITPRCAVASRPLAGPLMVLCENTSMHSRPAPAPPMAALLGRLPLRLAGRWWCTCARRCS